MKILVVDDELDLCEILQFNLETEGYEVVTANSAEEAFKLPLQEYALILLDVMMGEMSGFQMARKIKENPATAQIPIIFITALDDEDNTVKGLNIGADDYITKPFDGKELVARVKAVLRRMHEMKEEDKSAHLVIANLEIDMNAFTVKLNGKAIPCTPKETEILWTLASNPGMVFSSRG